MKLIKDSEIQSVEHPAKEAVWIPVYFLFLGPAVSLFSEPQGEFQEALTVFITSASHHFCLTRDALKWSVSLASLRLSNVSCKGEIIFSLDQVFYLKVCKIETFVLLDMSKRSFSPFVQLIAPGNRKDLIVLEGWIKGLNTTALDPSRLLLLAYPSFPPLSSTE